jgi:hypothetical protein
VFKQKQQSSELQNVRNQSNSTNANTNQFDVKDEKNQSTEMYATFHNKDVQIGFPLSFSPRIIKTYATADVLYKGVYQMKNDSKTDKFYCGNESFFSNGEKPTTSLVKIEDGE